jgi:GNAT superfamily N-acetyltransferase
MNASARENYLIRVGDPLARASRALIAELDAFNTALYPSESNHFDPPEALVGPQCVFLVVEQHGELVGCGAAKNCGGWAELKRMYLKPKARGGGIALAMLVQLLDWARAQKLPLAAWKRGMSASGRSSSTGARVSRKSLPSRPTSLTRCRYSWSVRSGRMRRPNRAGPYAFRSRTTEASAQRPGGAHELLEGVSLSTTRRKSG